MCKNTRTFYFFARPSFTRGMAGVLDLGANLQIYNESEVIEDSDNIALFNDWKQVGNDLKIATKKYERAK